MTEKIEEVFIMGSMYESLYRYKTYSEMGLWLQTDIDRIDNIKLEEQPIVTTSLVSFIHEII